MNTENQTSEEYEEKTPPKDIQEAAKRLKWRIKDLNVEKLDGVRDTYKDSVTLTELAKITKDNAHNQKAIQADMYVMWKALRQFCRDVKNLEQ